MINHIEVRQQTWVAPAVKRFVFALIITVILFLYSNAAPQYIKVAVEANLGGLVFILYSLWLVLAVTWFRFWQMILHASTDDA